MWSLCVVGSLQSPPSPVPPTLPHLRSSCRPADTHSTRTRAHSSTRRFVLGRLLGVVWRGQNGKTALELCDHDDKDGKCRAFLQAAAARAGEQKVRIISSVPCSSADVASASRVSSCTPLLFVVYLSLSLDCCRCQGFPPSLLHTSMRSVHPPPLNLDLNVCVSLSVVLLLSLADL